MGNANALTQSEDWAALIADAKTRKCYMDMDSLPKDLFMAKAPPHVRGLRAAPRPRLYDSQLDSRSGTPSEDDEKSNTSHALRNGNYRQYKQQQPQLENSLDDFDQSGDKSRDAWQYGVHKRQNGPGVGRRNL